MSYVNPSAQSRMPKDLSEYGNFIENYQKREFATSATINGGTFSHINGDRITYNYGGTSGKDEKDIEQKITEVIAEVLSLEKHETPGQKKSQTEVGEALNNYFGDKSMANFKGLNATVKQYKSLHENVGDAQKRSDIFQILKEYNESDEDKEKKELSEKLLELATKYRDELKNQTKGGGHSGNNIQGKQRAKN